MAGTPKAGWQSTCSSNRCRYGLDHIYEANAILSILYDFARKECVGWEGSCLRSARIPGGNQIDQGKARESLPSVLGLRGVHNNDGVGHEDLLGNMAMQLFKESSPFFYAYRWPIGEPSCEVLIALYAALITWCHLNWMSSLCCVCQLLITYNTPWRPPIPIHWKNLALCSAAFSFIFTRTLRSSSNSNVCWPVQLPQKHFRPKKGTHTSHGKCI